MIAAKKIPLDNLLTDALDSFHRAGINPFARHKKISSLRKRYNEYRLKKRFELFFAQMEPYLVKGQKRITEAAQIEIKKRTVRLIRDIDKKELLFDRPFLRFFLELGYLDVAEAFTARAGTDDKELSGEDIFQAMRNVWIMNSLQLAWDLPLAMTPSVYAYSMLYPYTDNFMDDPSVTIDAKQELGRKLHARLSSQEAMADGHRIFELISLIESEYPREIYPQVHQSILLISEAQSESLEQDGERDLSQDECLKLSFFKGGCSVLADAYLVKADLSESELHFAFRYGTFLQLIDDLQDVPGDKADGHQTLFTAGGFQDANVLRLIAYIDEVNQIDEADAANLRLIKEVIAACCLVMIMEAVGRNPSIVSPALYRQLELHAPVRLSFFSGMGNRIDSLIKAFI